YLQNDSRRLPAALISYHYLLHIATSICNTGPAWATWQYPMERLCGMLLPLVRSRQHPYINLQNQITMWNQFSLLQYKSEINKNLFTSLEKSSNHSETRIFIIEGVEEKLFSLSLSYCMNKTETQRLKVYYATALNKTISRLN
ncbi:41820_t:CDS:1, partial [Gigaspora margarita]